MGSQSPSFDLRDLTRRLCTSISSSQGLFALADHQSGLGLAVGRIKSWIAYCNNPQGSKWPNCRWGDGATTVSGFMDSWEGSRHAHPGSRGVVALLVRAACSFTRISPARRRSRRLARGCRARSPSRKLAVCHCEIVRRSVRRT